MQFPYACESHIRNFSKTMKFCYQSPTEYMTLPDEKKYAQRALEVVITAVQRKQMVMKPIGKRPGAGAHTVENSRVKGARRCLARPSTGDSCTMH